MRITHVNLRHEGILTIQRYLFVCEKLRQKGLNDDEISVVMSLLTIEDICAGFQWNYQPDRSTQMTLVEEDPFNATLLDYL